MILKLGDLTGLFKSGSPVALMNAEGELMGTSRPEGKDFTAFMLPLTDAAEKEVRQIGVLGGSLCVTLATQRRTARVDLSRVRREEVPLWFWNEVNGQNCRYTKEEIAELRRTANGIRTI